ncbi:MAG: alpha/beta fold hydrolase [Pyrinomonadaceae bacterium]
MKRSLALIIACAILAAASPTAAQSTTADTNEGYLVTPDKVRLFYKIVGQGTETLVAVHGGPGNSLESIRADLEPLAKGRRVIYYDQRGQGRSQLISDGKKLGYQQHVADLEAVRQHFGLDKITLLGNSWGGLLISLYAVAHPDRVERMVLHNPAPPMQGFLSDMQEEIRRRMNSLYKPEQIKRVRFSERPENWLKASDPLPVCREFYTLVLSTYTYSRTLDIGFKGDVCAGPIESVRQNMVTNGHVWRSLGDFNLVPKLGAVKAPVLVIHGAADVIPLRASEFWASGYPNARLLLIEKAGHISHVETPEIFFSAVETFLKGTFPAEAKKVERPARALHR